MRSYKIYSQGLSNKELIDKHYFNLEPIYGAELWMPLPEDKRYEVSNYGRVRKNYSNGKTKLLTPYINSSHYMTLSIKGVARNTSKWVMMAWTDFPEESIPTNVHHIDGNMYNNHISNLSVISPAEHQRLHPNREWHSFHKRKIVYFTIKDGKRDKVLKIFDSIKDASRATGKSPSYIDRVMNDGMPSGNRGFAYENK